MAKSPNITKHHKRHDEMGDPPQLWTEEKRKVAWWLAIGATHNYAAMQSGTDRWNLLRWLRDPVFADEVERLHRSAVERVEPSIMANVEFALDVQRRVMAGEIAASDDRATTAERLIGRILDRLLAVVAPATAGTAVAVAPVQVNVHAGSALD